VEPKAVRVGNLSFRIKTTGGGSASRWVSANSFASLTGKF